MFTDRYQSNETLPAPFPTLPVEISTAIFAYTVPDSFKVKNTFPCPEVAKLLTVSKSWGGLALSIPSLWTRLDFDLPLRLPSSMISLEDFKLRIQDILELSGRLLLNLVVRVSEPDNLSQDVLNILLRSSIRWFNVRLELPSITLLSLVVGKVHIPVDFRELVFLSLICQEGTSFDSGSDANSIGSSTSSNSREASPTNIPSSQVVKHTFSTALKLRSLTTTEVLSWPSSHLVDCWLQFWKWGTTSEFITTSNSLRSLFIETYEMFSPTTSPQNSLRSTSIERLHLKAANELSALHYSLAGLSALEHLIVEKVEGELSDNEWQAIAIIIQNSSSLKQVGCTSRSMSPEGRWVLNSEAELLARIRGKVELRHVVLYSYDPSH